MSRLHLVSAYLRQLTIKKVQFSSQGYKSRRSVHYRAESGSLIGSQDTEIKKQSYFPHVLLRRNSVAIQGNPRRSCTKAA